MRRSLNLLVAIPVFLALALPGSGKDKYDPTTLVFPSFLHTMGIRKATKTHLMIYTRNRVKVNDPQGIVVVRLNSWDDPKTKDDDDQVTGYGVNSGANMVVFNKSMTSLGFYGKGKSGMHSLNHPTAIAANEQGDVYVADTGNHRIVRLFNPKQSLKFVRAIGGRGALPGRFDKPTGVAMDESGMLYVSDTGNHRIQVIRPDDQLHLWFGDQGVQAGQLWHPAGIAVTNGRERWSHYKDKFIAVVDMDGLRIQTFSLDGKFQNAVRLPEIGFVEGKLAYVAIDYYSNMWVTDTVNDCVHKFDRKLNYLTTFGREGSGDKEFKEPRGIAIYKRFGQVFIAEKESAQYYWVGTDVLDLTLSKPDSVGLFSLDFMLTEPSYLTLKVKNETTSTEETVLERVKVGSGRQTIWVDGSLQRVAGDSSRQPSSGHADSEIAPGEYRFRLQAEPTYSSIKHFKKQLEARITIN